MGLELFIGSSVRKMINPQSRVYRFLQYIYRSVESIKRTKKLKQLNFNVMLADHCNLNCAHCNVFSPLAPKTFYDVGAFKNECARISELTGRKIDYIRFAGGEPLLHPDITEFFDIARFYFDKLRRGGGGMFMW
jgi:MoaA/NifB/PqqE/SkfB family radical SAM enzyme